MEKEEKWLLEEKYFGKASENFYKDVKRIKAGEPVDYVIGFTEFLGCKIDLSRFGGQAKRPLIPRPETEYWVGEAIKEVSRVFDGRQKTNLFVLDMFAGSGCIGLAIQEHVKNSDVTFADKFKYFDHPNFIKSDVFKGLNPPKAKAFRRAGYDYIFANPPYIPITRKSKVGKSVLKFEPKTSLFGGQDGLFYIRKFLRDAKKHLNIGGIIFMEFDPPQKTSIQKLTKKYNYKNCEFHRDQYNRWRWAKIY